MNRRSFLKSFGALAALAVAGPTLAKLAPTDAQRLITAMRSGLIENATFYLNGPIEICFSNLTINNCVFIYPSTYSGFLIEISGQVENISITNCHFFIDGFTPNSPVVENLTPAKI